MVNFRVKINYLHEKKDNDVVEVSSPCCNFSDVLEEVTHETLKYCLDNKDWIPKISVLEYADEGLIEIWNNEYIRIENAVRKGII